MNIRIFFFVVGVFALATSASNALAQTVPPATAVQYEYDATVPYVQCGPANMVPPSARPEEYKGCRKSSVASNAPLPQGVSENVLMGRRMADGSVVPELVSGRELVRQFGPEAAAQYSQISDEVCRNLTKNDGWRDAWRILRPILKVGAVALAWNDFGATYGILSLVTVGAGEVDQQFHDEDRRNWVKLAKAYCGLTKDYDRKYGKSLRDVSPVPQGTAGATSYYD